MSALDKRHGPSISVKMILTTTLLIIVIVVGFGLLNVWTVGRVFDRQVALGLVPDWRYNQPNTYQDPREVRLYVKLQF